MKSRFLFVAGVLFSGISLLLGLVDTNGMIIGMSVVALCLSIPATFYCHSDTSKYSLIATASVLICAILMTTVASYETLVGDGNMSRLDWIYLSATVQGIATAPMILLFYFVSASVFKASYNWVLVSGMGWLLGTGMLISRYLSVLVFQNTEVEAGMIVNIETVSAMLIGLIIFAIFSVMLGRTFKKNHYLITSNGLEVKR